MLRIEIFFDKPNESYEFYKAPSCTSPFTRRTPDNNLHLFRISRPLTRPCKNDVTSAIILISRERRSTLGCVSKSVPVERGDDDKQAGVSYLRFSRLIMRSLYVRRIAFSLGFTHVLLLLMKVRCMRFNASVCD